MEFKEFEERASAIISLRGSKTEMVHHAVHTIGRDFTVAATEKKCPAVSRDIAKQI